DRADHWGCLNSCTDDLTRMYWSPFQEASVSQLISMHFEDSNRRSEESKNQKRASQKKIPRKNLSSRQSHCEGNTKNWYPNSCQKRVCQCAAQLCSHLLSFVRLRANRRHNGGRRGEGRSSTGRVAHPCFLCSVTLDKAGAPSFAESA